MSAPLGLLGLSSVLLGPPALPEDPAPAGGRADVALTWSDSPTCRALDELRGRVREFAPQLRLADTPADARVDVHVELAGPGVGGAWAVNLSLQAGDGSLERRSFAAESCAVAVEAVALVIAVAVDPIAVVDEIEARRAASPPGQAESSAAQDESPAGQGERPATQGEASSSPEAIGSAQGEATAQPEPAQPLRPEPVPTDLGLTLPTTARPTVSSGAAGGDPGIAARFGVALLGGGGYGPLALGAADLGLRLALFGERWRAELRGLWFPPIVAAFDPGQVRVDGFSVDARGCGVLASGPLEFPLCGGVAGGLIRANAQGLANAATATQPLVQLELSAGLAWAPVERFALGVELEAMGQLASGGFSVDGAPALANLPVGVRALGSLELRLF